MSEIKRRRLEELEVHCHAGTKVGQYVPFYFCPRSVMLYLLYRGNSPGLTYQEGQRPILHLEADLHATVEWARGAGQRWAFSKGNAGAYYTNFFCDLAQLDVRSSSDFA
jgi:ssDNA thymidine ADP-ribosyltransferase, DarT